MDNHLNRLDEPVLMAVPKPLHTEFGIHYRLESCEVHFYGKAKTLAEFGIHDKIGELCPMLLPFFFATLPLASCGEVKHLVGGAETKNQCRLLLQNISSAFPLGF